MKMRYFWKQLLAVIFGVLVLSSDVAANYQRFDKDGSDDGCSFWTYMGVGIGAVGAVVAAPAVLTAAGFSGAGIAVGSLGAKMMSISALAGGGGIPAGGIVAGLQSAGAAGLGLAGKAAVGTAGAAIGAAVGSKVDEATCPLGDDCD